MVIYPVRSGDGITFFDFLRPQSRSEQLRASVIRPHRHSLQSSVNERARHPEPNSLLPDPTSLTSIDRDLAFGHRKLGRGSQRPFLSP
jgi:hypothetical protein